MTCQRGITRSIRSYNGCIIFDSYYISKQLHLCFTGTGAISNLFFVFPFGTGAQPMIILTLVIFYVNLFLFCCFFIILGLKYTCCSGKWSSMLRKPMDSLYAGCFPMGATTLINTAVDVINGRLNYGGKSFLYFVWAIWWLDVFISFVCCWVGVHAMYVFDLGFFPCVNANFGLLGLRNRNILWIR